MKPHHYILVLPFALLPMALHAQAIDKPTPATAAKLDRRDPNFMRCVRLTETGSLVRAKKICHTNAEWSKLDAAAAADADDLVSRTRQGFNPNPGG